MSPIIPTGTCFEDIGDIFTHYIFPLAREGLDTQAFIRIAHGILHPADQWDKLPICHAWVEDDRKDKLVIDCKFFQGAKVLAKRPKEAYYRENKITDVTHYTLQEFALMQILFGHSGPYEERYHVLCKGADKDPFLPPRAHVAGFVEELRAAAGDKTKVQALIARDRRDKLTGIDWDNKGKQRLVR